MPGENMEAIRSVDGTREFNIILVRLKSVFFDAPRATELPPRPHGSETGEVEFKVSTKTWRFHEHRYALEIHLDVHMSQDGTTVINLALDQLGTFRVIGYSADEAVGLLRTKGVESLYPYARELVHSLAGRAGFQRLQLPPLVIEGAGSEGWVAASDQSGSWLTHLD
jgi:protein-export chaperone SecB